MRFFMFVSLMLVLMMGIVMAGGIVTNTNQSAAYMRTLNRNASTNVDAVYYNPAGLTKLEDGLHLSLSNQSIWQTKTVTNDFAYLNNDEFVGDVAAPLYPNLYLAYKTGNLVISGGFEPIGGGGGAVYEDGLPFIDLMLAQYIGIPASYLNAALSPYGNITGYSYDDVYFEGSSIYYGGQFGASYKINDMFSAAVGARYVLVKNAYEGYLKGIALSNDSGLGDIAGVIPDMEVDATEEGSGIAGIFGVNISPNDALNIGIRYETITKLEIESETTVDDVGMFDDSVNTHEDMPAMLALGVSYKPMDKLRAELDLSYYFNEGVDWDGNEDLIDNGYEIGLAVEYCLTDKLLASVGFLYGDMNVTKEYQSDMSYSLPSSTVGFGFAYKLSEKILLNLGALNTWYSENEVDNGVYTTTYAKTTFGFAFGIDYKF